MPFSPGFFNLLIHRLKENKMNQFESRKETYAFFTRFLQEALGLGPDSIQLADIHRLRQHTISKNGKRTTRPIIKLSSVFNKNIILRSLKKLKSYNLKLSSSMGNDFEYIFVTEHLPKNLQLQKKCLLPAFKQAKSERKRATWQIDNAEYCVYVEGRKVKNIVCFNNYLILTIITFFITNHLSLRSFCETHKLYNFC